MKIFETRSQFIKEEGSVIAPKDAIIYKLTFTTSLYDKYQMELPQYELHLKTRGGYPYKSFLKINYRGVELLVDKQETNEDFVLLLLNNLKKGDYQKQMEKFFKDRLSKANFDKYKSILQTPNIKMVLLEKEIKTLNKKISEIENRLEKTKPLEKENQIMSEQIDAILKIVQN